jgi:hypothetical protein
MIGLGASMNPTTDIKQTREALIARVDERLGCPVVSTRPRVDIPLGDLGAGLGCAALWAC